MCVTDLNALWRIPRWHGTISTTWRRVTSPPSSTRRATLVTDSVYVRRCRPCSMFLAPNTWPSVAVRSVQPQLVCGTVCQRQCSLLSHWHFSTLPENWTVRAFLQLTLRLSNDFTAVWLTFTFPQLFAVAATLKSIDYNVAMTSILKNNNNNQDRHWDNETQWKHNNLHFA